MTTNKQWFENLLYSQNQFKSRINYFKLNTKTFVKNTFRSYITQAESSDWSVIDGKPDHRYLEAVAIQMDGFTLTYGSSEIIVDGAIMEVALNHFGYVDIQILSPSFGDGLCDAIKLYEAIEPSDINTALLEKAVEKFIEATVGWFNNGVFETDAEVTEKNKLQLG